MPKLVLHPDNTTNYEYYRLKNFLNFSRIWSLRQYYQTDLDTNLSAFAYIWRRPTLTISALNFP